VSPEAAARLGGLWANRWSTVTTEPSSSSPFSRASHTTRRRYDRLAGVYDMMEAGIERAAFRRWRRDLWSSVEGERILEVGVGTGKNIPYYPQGAHVVAIDLSPRMLQQARPRAAHLGADVELHEMDVEQLEFADASFDAVVATFVFCSVSLPVEGLREIRRVLRPGGRLHMLEHVLSRRSGLRQFMRLLNPAVVRIMGANIDRETRANIEAAGFELESERDLWLDIVKHLVARVPQEGAELPRQ
jgi:phosphatidylethanolamine/phosphatidyl-N-methylethanolamine N-methyltransferase